MPSGPKKRRASKKKNHNNPNPTDEKLVLSENVSNVSEISAGEEKTEAIPEIDSKDKNEEEVESVDKMLGIHEEDEMVNSVESKKKESKSEHVDDQPILEASPVELAILVSPVEPVVTDGVDMSMEEVSENYSPEGVVVKPSVIENVAINEDTSVLQQFEAVDDQIIKETHVKVGSKEPERIECDDNAKSVSVQKDVVVRAILEEGHRIATEISCLVEKQSCLAKQLELNVSKLTEILKSGNLI